MKIGPQYPWLVVRGDLTGSMDETVKTEVLCHSLYYMIKQGRSQWVRFNIIYRYKLLKPLKILGVFVTVPLPGHSVFAVPVW